MPNVVKLCTVCRSEYHSENLASFGDDLVCGPCKEQYVQCLKEGVTPLKKIIPKHAFRERKKLFVPRGENIPIDICCHCGAPAARHVSIKLPPPTFWTLRIERLSTAICQRHQRRAAAGACIFLIPLMLSLMGFYLASYLKYPILPGHALALIVFIALSAIAHVAYRWKHGIRKINCNRTGEDWFFITGLSEEYLSQFPNKSKDESVGTGSR